MDGVICQKDHTWLFVWCIYSGTPVNYSRAAELQRWPNTCLPKLLQFIICCLVNLWGLGCGLWLLRSTNGRPWHVRSFQKEMGVSTAWKSLDALVQTQIVPTENSSCWDWMWPAVVEASCWVAWSSSFLLHFQPWKSQSLPGLVHLSEEIRPAVTLHLPFHLICKSQYAVLGRQDDLRVDRYSSSRLCNGFCANL